MPTHLQSSIQSALKSIPGSDFRSGHLDLLKTLGYESTRMIEVPGAKPEAFIEMLEADAPEPNFDKKKALYGDWSRADLLFQLTNEELGGSRASSMRSRKRPIIPTSSSPSS